MSLGHKIIQHSTNTLEIKYLLRRSYAKPSPTKCGTHVLFLRLFFFLIFFMKELFFRKKEEEEEDQLHIARCIKKYSGKKKVHQKYKDSILLVASGKISKLATRSFPFFGWRTKPIILKAFRLWSNPCRRVASVLYFIFQYKV